MRTIIFTLAVGMLAACGVQQDLNSANSSQSALFADSSKGSDTPEKICGVAKINYQKMTFQLRDQVRTADRVGLIETGYRFAFKTFAVLDSAVAARLKETSGAAQINEIAGPIGTGRGSLCAIVKLANDNRVRTVEGARKLEELEEP